MHTALEAQHIFLSPTDSISYILLLCLIPLRSLIPVLSLASTLSKACFHSDIALALAWTWRSGLENDESGFLIVGLWRKGVIYTLELELRTKLLEGQETNQMELCLK